MAEIAAEVGLELADCPRCHAQRPGEEILHKACGNCANLAQIIEFKKHEKTMKADAEKAEADAGSALKSLPPLDKPASSLYDNEVGVWWFGINLKAERLDPINLMFLLDQAKPGVLQALGDWKVRQARKNSLLVQAKETVSGMMDRLSKTKKGVQELLAPK